MIDVEPLQGEGSVDPFAAHVQTGVIAPQHPEQSKPMSEEEQKKLGERFAKIE